MKKTLTRMTCLAFAMLFALTCILIPASAANDKLNLSYDGKNANFSYTILDENGNPVCSMDSLPFGGPGSITLRPNETIVCADTDGGYFNVPANTWVSFSISLSTRAGLDFGCELPSGAQWWKYYGTPSKQHQGDFRVSTGGNMKFLIKNTSASPTTLTYIYIG